MAKKKGGSKKAASGPVEGGDPSVLLSNYKAYCKAIGISPDSEVSALISGERETDGPFPPVQICTDSKLGPGGIRALTTAILGKNPVCTGGAYKLLTTLRFWRANAGDDGAEALAQLLAEGGEDVKILFLQLLDCKVSIRGCESLGNALKIGANKSLVTLQLDHNQTVGSEGVKALCKGICFNKTLKRLGLSYCDIGPEGGEALKSVLAFPASSLSQLNLRGNRIEGRGFKAICSALRRNKALVKLDVTDNRIGPDVEALTTFADAMKYNQKLSTIMMEHNLIGEEGATALKESGAFDKGVNGTLKCMSVDVEMPDELFKLLNRTDGGKKGKKKKK